MLIAAGLCNSAFDCFCQAANLDMYAASGYPSSIPTDKLATLVEDERARSVDNPFPFMDVMEMAPNWAKSAVRDEPGEAAVSKTKRPDTLTFFASLDNLSLAAHACGVCSCCHVHFAVA